MNFTAKFVVSEHVREKKKRGKRVEAPQRGDCNNLVLAAALVPVVTDLNLDVQVMIGQDHCLCLEHTHTRLAYCPGNSPLTSERAGSCLIPVPLLQTNSKHSCHTDSLPFSLNLFSFPLSNPSSFTEEIVAGT